MRYWIPFFSLLFLSSVLSADIIYLKNGKQIECLSASEEGNEVKYLVAGGKVSIPKSVVLKIVKGEPQKSQQQEPKEQPEAPRIWKGEKPSSSPVNRDVIQNLEKQDRTDPKVKLRLARIYSDLGLLDAERKDFHSALQNFQKAYELVKNEDTTYNLAAVHFVLKEDTSAEALFAELLKINPESAEALYYLGDIAWRKESLEDAQDYWQRAFKISGDPTLKEKLERLTKERQAAEAYEKDASRHFVLRYDGGSAHPALVEEISEFLEDAYQDLSSRFEVYPNTPFVVVLYPRETFFDVTDMPAWSGGANDGKIKIPVRGLDSMNDQLRSVLLHELTHSFVRLKSSDNYPSWLQEGLAQWNEGKRADTEQTRTLGKLARNNQLPPIEKLSGTFLGASSGAASILYLMSLSFTEYLLDHYPSYQMNELLEELGKGYGLQEAFEKAYLVPLAQVDQQWRNEFVE